MGPYTFRRGDGGALDDGWELQGDRLSGFRVMGVQASRPKLQRNLVRRRHNCCVFERGVRLEVYARHSSRSRLTWIRATNFVDASRRGDDGQGDRRPRITSSWAVSESSEVSSPSPLHLLTRSANGRRTPSVP